jgi:hypothetical protein
MSTDTGASGWDRRFAALIRAVGTRAWAAKEDLKIDPMQSQNGQDRWRVENSKNNPMQSGRGDSRAGELANFAEQPYASGTQAKSDGITSTGARSHAVR